MMPPPEKLLDKSSMLGVQDLPGADISGFIRESNVGPHEVNELMMPPVAVERGMATGFWSATKSNNTVWFCSYWLTIQFPSS